jgi:hypothetical protein
MKPPREKRHNLENICKLFTQQGINFQNIQNLIQFKNRQKTRTDISQEDKPMTKKYMKKYSISLIIKGSANQNHMRHHFTPGEMAIN